MRNQNLRGKKNILWLKFQHIVFQNHYLLLESNDEFNVILKIKIKNKYLSQNNHHLHLVHLHGIQYFPHVKQLQQL